MTSDQAGIRDGDAEELQPGGRLQLEEVPHRRVERLGHGHLIRGVLGPIRRGPSPATDQRHRHRARADITPGRAGTGGAGVA